MAHSHYLRSFTGFFFFTRWGFFSSSSDDFGCPLKSHKNVPIIFVPRCCMLWDGMEDLGVGKNIKGIKTTSQTRCFYVCFFLPCLVRIRSCFNYCFEFECQYEGFTIVITYRLRLATDFLGYLGRRGSFRVFGRLKCTDVRILRTQVPYGPLTSCRGGQNRNIVSSAPSNFTTIVNSERHPTWAGLVCGLSVGSNAIFSHALASMRFPLQHFIIKTHTRRHPYR